MRSKDARMCNVARTLQGVDAGSDLSDDDDLHNLICSLEGYRLQNYGTLTLYIYMYLWV